MYNLIFDEGRITATDHQIIIILRRFDNPISAKHQSLTLYQFESPS